MCSISGFIDFNKNTSTETLERINRSMTHRGPDGEGIYFEEQSKYSIGFAHRRLSIIDLTEGGKQPMHFQHFTIVFNGEMYNYQEVKNELVVLGHVFQSTSDTEVILHAYAQWGKSCVHKFIGMFAFVIYDQKNNYITICRDRAGVKPFYYYWHNGLFLFASELKAFHQHPNFEKRINNNAIASFMQYGYVPTPHCIFEHCHKLNPGYFLEFNLSDVTFTQTKYWDVYEHYNKPKLAIGFDEAKATTEKLLTSAFNYRMVADVPVGMFLSGGYDSTCVTAILQKDSARKIRTFTIGVGDPKLNEAPFAKEIAAHLGTEHTEYYCTEKDALDLVPKLPFYFDEPFGDSSAIPTMLVSSMARKEVTVALSADAGDEIFAGYNRYDFVTKINQSKKIPTPIRQLAAFGMGLTSAQSIPVLSRNPLFAQRYEKIRALLKDPSTSNLMRNVTSTFFEEDLASLFLEQPKRVDSYFDSQLDSQFADTLSQMMATDFQTYMLDDILQKVDRATMSASLEGREPFLDHRIIEWAAQLPNDFKYRNGVKKYMLREIVHQYVPKSMMERPKMGFAIPLSQWLNVDLKPIVLAKLSIEKISAQKIFRPNEVAKIVNDFYGGKSQNLLKVWYLLMFQLWYEEWMS
jgi:asparagine synthase (glutamine-hydrolysing)